jgi:D-isomer specific 2-hydroxyacid dehydrogenase, NAD binding domain
MKSQASLLEVTRALSNCAQVADFDFGADTAVVAVQHMLWQTVDLLAAIAGLGVKRENIFALGKVYSNSPIVIGTLRDRGITVVDSNMPVPGQFERYFERDVDRLWEIVARNLAQRNVKRILILDDGGQCITRVPAEVLERYELCGVEQTSFGIFLFEQQPPPFAVMAWARTAVKLHIGGPLFSHCLLNKFESRILGGDVLTGANVGIIGLGSIGGALANLLMRQHNNVFFYDPDTELQVSQRLAGRITRVESLEELMLRCEYVFGCSGRQPFKDRWPLKYRPGIKLFSGSGGDQEFDAIINSLRTEPDFSVAPLTWDIRSNKGPYGPISTAYLGYPYNFVSRDLEAVPTSVVQLETGGLLAALIQARTYLSLYETGRAENSGIHRISPEAQTFVYQRWLTMMKGRRIDLQRVYGYDPAVLEAARDRWWFFNASEPHPSLSYEPHLEAENLMAHMIEGGGESLLGVERKLEANLCSF